jgi:hypothetical protein
VKVILGASGLARRGEYLAKRFAHFGSRHILGRTARDDQAFEGPEQENSMAQVELTTGLPPDALRRLSDSEEGAAGPGLFTSDLSVNEFLLIKEAGFIAAFVLSLLRDIGRSAASIRQ